MVGKETEHDRKLVEMVFGGAISLCSASYCHALSLSQHPAEFDVKIGCEAGIPVGDNVFHVPKKWINVPVIQFCRLSCREFFRARTGNEKSSEFLDKYLAIIICLAVE